MLRSFLLALSAAALCVGPVAGQSPKPFPEFSAKRVKPPKAGERGKITVQIAPQQRRAASPAETAAPAAAGSGQGNFNWFWAAISPDAAASGPGRLDQAIRTLSSAGANLASPRLQHLQDIARSNGRDILRATVGTQVSPALVLAVISVESGGRHDAVSGAGAEGLMQLMPDTAARFGVTDSFEPVQNITGGVKYLNWLMEEFGRDPILVLAGYNAGEGSVRKHDGVPPFAETRDYVPKVLAAFQVARGLCLTPPELISDGCVFANMN